MKIISVTFDFGNCRKYAIMSQVLQYSIEKNCPTAEFSLIQMSSPLKKAKKRCFDSNTIKIRKWIEIMEKTNDNIVFLDCDTLVMQKIEDVFDMDFDVGITINGTGKIPYNGGVVFCKNTTRAKDFMRLWCDCNTYLYKNPAEHIPWRNKYAGMNQAALGFLLERKKFSAKVVKLPCAIWNLCRNNWKGISEQSKILHVKSELRRAVFNESPTSFFRFPKAIEIWHQYAQEAGIDFQFNYANILQKTRSKVEEARIKLKRRKRSFQNAKTLGRDYTSIARKSRRRGR